ncbi:MAG: dihydroneopterin aldolase, partial [Steroidobacteraceae bacterium]
MDKIFLSAVSVECIVGIWEWERRVKQTVIIDLEMAADIRRAAAT